MLSVDEALLVCRSVASLAGDENLREFDQALAVAVERLLVEVALVRSEADHYREQLKAWGIPAKRRTLTKLEKGGFEAGWSE